MLLLSALLLLLPVNLNFCEGSRILALFPYPLKSHFIAFDALFVELAKRGHDVTVMTSFPKNKNITNYHEIDSSHCLHIPDILFDVGFASTEYKTAFHLINFLQVVPELHEPILACNPIQDLLKTKEKYDLLITEAFCSDALIPFAYILDLPLVLFSSLPILPWYSDRVGNIDNPSFIQFQFSDVLLEYHSTFYQRLYNVATYVMSRICHKFIWEPKTNELVRKYLGSGIPPVQEIAKNTSMILSFSHFSMNSPRPLVPSVVEVGGIHIEDAAPLPKDIEKFINESTHGVIYFCLGSLLKAKTMPVHIRQAFEDAFRQLPQRVLWKWENETLPNKPDNVMIKKWMPQRDILAHPNIKLFISHGGALGLNEAVFEGVPIIGIPFYGDQKMNIKTIQAAGAGELLWYNDITAEHVLEKIKTVLNNKRYHENAKKLSSVFRDRPMSPTDNAVFWTEYVLRHKGAHHLKTAATHLEWYQYLLLDVIAFVLGALFVSFYLIRKLVKSLARAVFGKSKKTKVN
ncbi:UDP-glycosyltransferase UGT5-like [Planococcus citri]|uniref:UDP-glycosyltransferase UGT5-like n=1 Tax=Planococcus citri TaxID=170843 RepID=UPI0031F84B82